MKDIQITLINFSRRDLKRFIVICVNRFLKRSYLKSWIKEKKKKRFPGSFNAQGNITKVVIEICNFVHTLVYFSLFASYK